MAVVIRDAFVNTFHAELFHLSSPQRAPLLLLRAVFSECLANTIPRGMLIFNCLGNMCMCVLIP